MKRDGGQKALATAVIPAFNEASTICGVIRVVENHPLIDEVIVVDDGSADGTAEQAERTSARVIRLPSNQGKAGAMERGVEEAGQRAVLFLDADILGLTREMVTTIVEPVLSGKHAMFVGIRGRRLFWLNRILRFSPILGGERAVTKELWYQVPPRYKKNFQIEIALNFHTKRLGQSMGFCVLPGLSQVIKEKKRGFCLGLYQRLLMCADVAWIGFRLYVLWNIKMLFHRRRRRSPQAHPAV